MRKFLLFFSLFFIFINCSDLLAQSQSSYPQIKLLLDLDKSFVDRIGGVTKATTFANELVAKVDAIYRRDLGLTVTLSGLHIWDVDSPFNTSTNSTLLSSFAYYSEINYRGIYDYDVAQLLVGSGMGGEGGIAYQGSACGTSLTSPFAYSAIQPDITDEYEFNAHLSSHELGHNLNAEHDEFPSCRIQTVMCPAQIGGRYSSSSISEVSLYVSQRQIDGCFSLVQKADPLQNIRVTSSIVGTTVKYKVRGAENCTSLTLVAAPSIRGLNTLFGYLQLGKLQPDSEVNAISRNVLNLKARNSKLFIGAYCNGQLSSSRAVISGNKIRGGKSTTSVILALRSLKKKFR